ncbi:MAG: hypothetical protein U0930_15115 [Pirellulales bacterium]
MSKPHPNTDPKIGSEHAAAMFRQGLHELRNIFNFENSNIVTTTEQGVWGTKTPGEVARDRRDLNQPEQQQEADSIVDSHMHSAQQQPTRAREISLTLDH